MTKPEWKRPETIDTIEKISDISDDRMKYILTWAEENLQTYEDLVRLLKKERGIRMNLRIHFVCVNCGEASNGYPSSLRVIKEICISCEKESQQ